MIEIESDDEDDLLQFRKHGLSELPKEIAEKDCAAITTLDMTQNVLRSVFWINSLPEGHAHPPHPPCRVVKRILLMTLPS